MRINSYIQLMRLNKPVGILLLLWPTLWALWIAAHGFPSVKDLFIFIAGVIVMRSAGCVINDFAERKYDSNVLRTKNRPLTSGKILACEAIALFSALCLIAFTLVLFTNSLTLKLAFFAVITAIAYPFMKRYTHWPQFILGVAFSFSIPMAFATEINHVPSIAILIMLINILWTIIYDTQYAMVDRDDDVKIGIKSTAILFRKQDRLIIVLFQLTKIILLCFLGFLLSFTWVFFSAIFICSLLFLYQQKLIVTRIPQHCFQAFLNNQWVGLVIFMGIFLNSFYN